MVTTTSEMLRLLLPPLSEPVTVMIPPTLAAMMVDEAAVHVAPLMRAVIDS